MEQKENSKSIKSMKTKRAYARWRGSKEIKEKVVVRIKKIKEKAKIKIKEKTKISRETKYRNAVKKS